MTRAQAVGGGEDSLDFVTDDVAAEVKGLAVDPLALRLVGFAELRVVGREFRAADGDGEDEFETVFGEAPRGLGGEGQSRGEPEPLLGRLVGIGHQHGLRDGGRRRLDEEAGAPHAGKNGPAHLPYAIAGRLGDEGGLGFVAVAFHRGGQTWIDDAEDGLEARAVGLDGFCVGFRRREIAGPMRRASGEGFGDFALCEAMRAVHESRGEVGFGPVERLGLREWCDVRGCGGGEPERDEGEERGEEGGEEASARFHGEGAAEAGCGHRRTGGRVRRG